MMTFAWPGEPFGRNRWLVDRLLTTWQNWNDGLVERRPCPSTSAWRRPKESAWSVPFAHEPWARAVPVGEFLGSRRPAGHVRHRWPCSDVDGFPPIVANACWFRGSIKRARNQVTPGQFMSVAKMCASMKTHGRSPTFSWIRSSLNPTLKVYSVSVAILLAARMRWGTRLKSRQP